MRRNNNIKLTDQLFDTVLRVIEYRSLLGFVVIFVVLVLYNLNLINGIRALMSDIISFSTVLLTIIGLAYSVLLVIQDKEFIRKFIVDMGNAYKELIKLLQSSVIWCIVVVTIALSIQIFNFEMNTLFKNFIAAFGIYSFWMMLTSCIGSFLITFKMFDYSI